MRTRKREYIDVYLSNVDMKRIKKGYAQPKGPYFLSETEFHLSIKHKRIDRSAQKELMKLRAKIKELENKKRGSRKTYQKKDKAYWDKKGEKE